MIKPTLSETDVQKLLQDPSPERRAITASKIAMDFNLGSLSSSERALAEEIFRVMVKDAAIRVREALAQNLKENPDVPHDVALNLARDVDRVSLPMIRFSDVLNDVDLLELVRENAETKQVAIAERTHVSPAISDALVETQNENVVTVLVENHGAEISERALQKVLDDFTQSERVHGAMAHRPKLPLKVGERLVALVSETLREDLVKHHELPPSLASDLIFQSRERVTVGLTEGSSDHDLYGMIHQMHDNGRLTPSIVLRALCMGDMPFFEVSMAVLARTPLVNARILVHDSGELGLRAIFDRAHLPKSFFPAVRAAIDVATETDYDGEENDRARYSRRMLERILTQYGDLGVDFDSDDLEYLLSRVGKLPVALARGAGQNLGH
ncbi:DUF2336 domain-containing protein [Varunaivibrio sulfuroxidans]|uniref:Uncharacterized protein (DUF2336 family) n=1 Tax=Varunaivibrio sulfuroxidans TaxID=1773489 RepID=A0A4R3J9J9_9PROT|nr:DUF2336 domain-containing protein [Varunaivibrio sulfuroxidans]TCS62629.1 uncharacterized protein (DUF2336 family) [Varunaivibrio sulfuroxidans]WES30704.1 DUF2336 domain-containing protein [Varunaivibrio sulfuroxidans]